MVDGIRARNIDQVCITKQVFVVCIECCFLAALERFVHLQLVLVVHVLPTSFLLLLAMREVALDLSLLCVIINHLLPKHFLCQSFKCIFKIFVK